jgi:hypothetical protein
MQLLWIILRALFPTDPVQQCIGAARHRIALMASQVFSPQSLFLLEHDPQARLHIEALIIDYEAALHMAIGARACQIAKIRFRYHPKTFYRPTRALSLAALLKRIRALVTMLNNIERLAQIRAERLKRERDADPLGLGATSPLRHDAAQRTPVCETEGVNDGAEGAIWSGGPNRDANAPAGAASAQAPPVFDVYLNPQPASQAHLRDRGPVPKPLAFRPQPPYQDPAARGCGGIGRRTGFRYQRATVGVRVPPPAPALRTSAAVSRLRTTAGSRP